MKRLLNKIYKSDVTYLLLAGCNEIIPQVTSESIETREITRAELVTYSNDPTYFDLSKASIEGVGEEYDTHAFGTFIDGKLTGHIFHTTTLVEPRNNSAGYPFCGIGLKLPEDVVYFFKGFALPEYRGRGHVGIAIEYGIRQLVSSNGWAISTSDINNHSSIKMIEKVGLKKQHIFKEKRLLGRGFYSFPTEIQLDTSDDEASKRITVFK